MLLSGSGIEGKFVASSLISLSLLLQVAGVEHFEGTCGISSSSEEFRCRDDSTVVYRVEVHVLAVLSVLLIIVAVEDMVKIITISCRIGISVICIVIR